MTKKGHYGQLFKNAFVVSGGEFAGILPQLFLGACIFYVGMNMKEKGNKNMGNILMIIGALFMGNTWLAAGSISNAVKN